MPYLGGVFELTKKALRNNLKEELIRGFMEINLVTIAIPFSFIDLSGNWIFRVSQAKTLSTKRFDQRSLNGNRKPGCGSFFENNYFSRLHLYLSKF